MATAPIQNPLISVIMPVYNRETYLREAIESILNQTYSNLELILADDGSTDGSGELIHYYTRKDSRVRAAFLSHRGTPQTFNRAVGLARGPLILRQDSDDIAYPDRIARQHQWMLQNGIDICGCQALIFGCNSKALGWKDSITTLPITHGAIVYEMLFQIAVWGGAMLMRTEICKQHPFSSEIQFTDSAWPMQMSLRYKLGNVPEVLLRVRRHEKNTTESRSEDFGKEGTKARFNYFYHLFPKTSLADYIAFARLADGVPMTTLEELERAGRWLLELARYPEQELQKRMARRWQAACNRSATLGHEVEAIYTHFARQLTDIGLEFSEAAGGLS